MMGLGIITFLLLALAVLLQFALIRDKSVIDSVRAEACRWLMTAGFVGVASRVFDLVWTGDIQYVPWHPLGAIAMVALASVGLSFDRLMRSKDERFDDCPCMRDACARPDPDRN